MNRCDTCRKNWGNWEQMGLAEAFTAPEDCCACRRNEYKLYIPTDDAKVDSTSDDSKPVKPHREPILY